MKGEALHDTYCSLENSEFDDSDYLTERKKYLEATADASKCYYGGKKLNFPTLYVSYAIPTQKALDFVKELGVSEWW